MDGSLFAAVALCHLWYLPMFYLTSSDEMRQWGRISALLDCLTVIPLLIVLLFVMLQDRRPPLWPVALMMAPLVAGSAWCVVSHSNAILPLLFVYFVLMCIGLVFYMAHAFRQYGRWLRDNFADLEYKEVWQSVTVLAFILLTFCIYSVYTGALVYVYIMEVNIMILVCYLLWRTETLSDLSIHIEDSTENAEDNGLSLSISSNIGTLLKQYCEEPQLYLQHDISITQLAKLIGVKRSYLNRHFALQGVTYNAYINGLLIQNFVNLYHSAVAAHQPMTAQQLAHQSGFSNYSTFSAAFKKKMGMTVTEWMRFRPVYSQT